MENFIKFLQQSQSYEDAPFLDPKWSHLSLRKFFRKPVDKPSSYHSCLPTFQNLKSDINLLMKYWRLKNTKLFLVITWEIDFSQSYSFCRILKNHKIFLLHQFQTKLMTWFSEKVQINHAFCAFWLFLASFFWKKNPALSHITKSGPLTPY